MSWKSWNFVRFHEIPFQTDAESFCFLSWKTKQFYPWKMYFLSRSLWIFQERSKRWRYLSWFLVKVLVAHISNMHVHYHIFQPTKITLYYSYQANVASFLDEIIYSRLCSRFNLKVWLLRNSLYPKYSIEQPLFYSIWKTISMMLVNNHR